MKQETLDNVVLYAAIVAAVAASVMIIADSKATRLEHDRRIREYNKDTKKSKD